VQDPPVTDIERARDQTAAAVIRAEIAIEGMGRAMRELRDAIAHVALPPTHSEDVGETPPSLP
jgi:hypothetical protein